MNHQSTIRNISKEIKRECFRTNINVTENFIHYYVGLLYLNPQYGISANILSNRDAVVSFVKMVVNQLRFQNTPYFLTLKLQWYYKEFLKSKEKAVEEEREHIRRKLSTLRHLILKKPDIQNEEDIMTYKKKLVCYASLYSGLGNPLLEPVYQEGLYALNSIMDDAEIIEFTDLPMDEKESQLDAIAKLISGIRLFNKDTKKGGEGIPDLAEIISLNKYSIKVQLQIIVQDLDNKIPQLTSILEKCYVYDQTDQGRTTMKLEVPEGLQESDINNLKFILIALRQYEYYVRAIIDRIHSEKVRSMLLNYRINLESIISICSERVAVSSVKVFPLFEKHTNLWMSLQNEGIYLLHLSNVIKMLTQFASLIIYPEEIIDQLSSKLHVESNANRIHKILSEPMISNLPPEILDVVPLTSFADPSSIRLYGLGFDLFKLAYTNGVIVPGTWNGGIVICHNIVKCLFSDTESFNGFKEDVSENLLRALEVFRTTVVFIEMFHLRSVIEGLMEEKVLFNKPTKLYKGISIECQTEDHIEEGFIDPTYTWNVWDLKKEALQKAKLTHCTTVSTQTEMVYNKWSVQVQTQDKKDANLSTKVDNYSNVPKPSRFLFGLRGRKDDKQIDLELTRPVKE